MKSIKAPLLVFFCLLFIACSETDNGSYQEPITIYEKINGEWKLMNLKMVDEFAKANSIEPNEQNLSALFNYQDFKITFNLDDKMQPTTYNVSGNVPPIFQLNGYWQLSSSFQTTSAEAIEIALYSDEQKTNKTDNLRLTSVPGSNKEMEIQLVRKSSGVPFISYIFNLSSNN